MWVGRFENDFIDQLFFEYRPWECFAVFEYFSQNRCVTWILDVGFNRVFDVIEEGFEAGITGAFGGLFVSDQTNGRVIDAQHKFAKKRYFNKYSWSPRDEIRAAIAEAIFGKDF